MTFRVHMSGFAAAALLSGGLTLGAQTAPRPGLDWPQFRGLAAAGVADGFPLPVHWDVKSGENIRWKVAIGGLSHSSPIVWHDVVCVTTAVAENKQEALKVGLYGDITPVDDATAMSWEVHCIDKRSGAKRWSAVAHKGVPAVKRHPKGTHANSTLATDGRVIVAMFGSEGLYAYDISGKLLWERTLGVLESGFFQVPAAQWGFASSPIIYGNLVVIQADVLKDSFLAAFDLFTGKEIWRTARNDYPTWSTPTIQIANGRPQVVVNGFKHMGGYDLETGKPVWWMQGGGDIPVPTPVLHPGIVFLTNAHGGAAPIFGVRSGATGDINVTAGTSASQHIAWSRSRDGAYMQTPLVYGALLYVCRDNGVLTAFEAETGKQVYQQRLADGRTGFSASAVAGDGKLYYTSEDGSIFVVRAGATFEQLAENDMGETTMATPAISEGMIFFRTRGHLVAVGGSD